ncbi:MAG: hypothetical protein N5P05_002250 [Chroococcopsis gigantea SAG 12.99]|nr:hypothetical protein [Chroococcopsis gigantea SAG 12.99]
MFKDFKTSGYNLEDTKVTGERLESLILLIAIAHFRATITGQEIKDKGVQKYVGRIKEKSRITSDTAVSILVYMATPSSFGIPVKN